MEGAIEKVHKFYAPGTVFGTLNFLRYLSMDPIIWGTRQE
jgi:hypothetical protein